MLSVNRYPNIIYVRNFCDGIHKPWCPTVSGVTTFAIDLDKKEVTVMGNISPIGVLESVCKVKNAEFWPHEKLI